MLMLMRKSFAGRTLATLSAPGNRKVQAGFEPLVKGFVRVPYDDLTAVEQVAANNPDVVAILVEPIQGEGGIRIPDAAYLQGLRKLCDANGWLLILDEVQSGIGRTGKWFAHQHTGITPDVMTLAKGLGSGVPVGACLTAGNAVGTFKPGNHGSTFGGNPLACTAALTTLTIMEKQGMLDHAATLGAWIKQRLQERLGSLKGVVAVRGQGLMIGIELNKPCGELVGKALDSGLLINVTADSVVRLLPSLIYTRTEAQQLVDMLCPLIESLLMQE